MSIYKFFLYSVLVILYLGLAKMLSPSEIGVQYLQNEKYFSKVITTDLATAILVDTHATGFLIKSYYQKYRVITGYDMVEELIVRTSKEFARKNLPNIGLSIYRRINGKEELLPAPPGSTYIGNPEFGEWKKTPKGDRRWRFYKSFKNFPRYLGWGDYSPDEDFFKELKTHNAMNQAFYGPNKEFGPNGSVTRKNFPHFFKEERTKKKEVNSLLLEYLKENF